MAYYPKKIKDNEIFTLHYLLEELLHRYFDCTYEELENSHYLDFVNVNDNADSGVEKISHETVKKIFSLYEYDNEYRPLYSSINFLIYGLKKKKMSFESFQIRHSQDIDEHKERLDYKVYQSNYEPIKKKKQEHHIQKYDFGGATIQIDLSDSFTSKLIQDIEPVIGNIVTDKVNEKIKDVQLQPNPRINIRLALKEVTRQKNIDSIVAKALTFARSHEASEEPVDPDWMSYFFDMAQDTSNENMQYIWAKILADEVDNPGSFSRRAINAIKLIGSDEAKIFTLLCNCLWEIYPGETRSDRVLIKNSNELGYYSDSTWGFDGLLLRHLEDLGLVHETFITLEKEHIYNISYFGTEHVLSPKEKNIEVEMVRLSTIGAEIYDVVITEPNKEYYNHTLEYLKESNILKK